MPTVQPMMTPSWLWLLFFDWAFGSMFAFVGVAELVCDCVTVSETVGVMTTVVVWLMTTVRSPCVVVIATSEELDVLDVLDVLDELDELEELDELDELDELEELDELDELDELNVLDELHELDVLDDVDDESDGSDDEDDVDGVDKDDDNVVLDHDSDVDVGVKIDDDTDDNHSLLVVEVSNTELGSQDHVSESLLSTASPDVSSTLDNHPELVNSSLEESSAEVTSLPTELVTSVEMPN